MVKIAVIGDRESVKGFAALGLTVFSCEDNNAKEIFKGAVDESYGIIYITEHLAEILSEEIKKIEKNISPSVVAIPGLMGNNGIGIKSLKAAVEKAVGSDIIFNGEDI